MEERAKDEQRIKGDASGDPTEDERFLEAVRVGIEQANRGEFIEESEMDARVERMLQGLKPGSF